MKLSWVELNYFTPYTATMPGAYEERYEYVIDIIQGSRNIDMVDGDLCSTNEVITDSTWLLRSISL